jgi:hypothetical protein
MIRALRALADCWRNRRAPQPEPQPAPSIAERTALDHLFRRAVHLNERAAQLAAAAEERDFEARQRHYCRAFAADARAEACLALAGAGPLAAETAAQMIRDAELWDRMAGQPRPVPSEPQEAAHA